jgi:thioester reductase-like protein
MDKIGATDNFFELGGTSLMVTRVIIEADKAGHHIAYGDVFANPTPRQLANFLTGGTVNEDEEARNHNYGPINNILENNTLDAFKNGEQQPIGNVLITGATGFLGIHILKELIDRKDVPVIWCMVRAENEEKAERRLKGMLYYYFSNNYNELFGNRIRIVNGDVTHEIKVDGKVDTVFNCAAVVKHFSKGTEIEDVNVGGASHCVQFCLLNHARLIHVSTYSTAGMSINGMPPEHTVYTEQKLYFGQSLNNQYIHSKFISERIVLDAIALHKLNAKVMRVGNLAPRSTDGEFQINFQTNSAMGRIRVYQMLGCYPYELTGAPMEFSPINEVAKAIVLLSQTPQSCCLFHPFNDHYVHFGDVLAELGKIGEAPRQVETEAFGEALEAAKQDPEKAKRLSSLIAYQDMAHGQKAVIIPADNQYTSQVLYRLGFHWSPTSWDYVDQMLAAIAGFGYFEL